MLDDDEKKYFNGLSEPEDYPSVWRYDKRAELVQLTCAAMQGLMSGPTVASVSEFATIATKLAIESQRQIDCFLATPIEKVNPPS